MDDDASRRLLDTAPVAILGQRLDGSLSYANPAAGRLFGWDRDAMIGMNVEETFIADRNRHRDVEVMGILIAGRTWSGELPLRHRDGSVFPGHVTATLTRDERGEAAGIVGTVVDLRPIYSAREEVADAEARFRALVERIPLVTYIDQLRPSDRTVYISPQIEDLLGYPRERFLGDQDFFTSILHPDDRDRVLANMGESRIEDAGRPSEYRVIAADGRTVWVLDQDTLVRDRAGNPLHLEGYWLDITERKEAEAAREASGELARRDRGVVEQRTRAADSRYRGLVEQVPVASYLFRLDEHSTPIYVSPQIERIFGYSAEEWLSDPGLWVRLIHPEDRGRVLASTSTANSSGSGVRLEYRALTRDGRTIWVRDESVVAMDESVSHREPVVRGYIADITAEKEAAESIRRGQLLETTLSHLTGRLADDMHDALTSVIGHAELVAKMLPPDSPAREHVAEIGRAAGRGADLVEEMLADAGASQHRIPLRPAPDTVESTADGEGLPAPIAIAPDRGRARILIVAGEDDVRALTARLVQTRGMTSVTTTGAEEALDLVRSNPDAFDACLLDIPAPALAGVTAIRGLQAVRPDLPIVVMSRSAALARDTTILELGVAGFIDKPFTPDRIAGVLLPLVDAGLHGD
jgi:PAS domain S-box-containing protein